MVDIEAAYTFKDRYSIIVGADNVFDEFPETHFLFPDFSFGEKYPASSPIGYHGGFWYVRLSAEF
jgi:iron complex outermembrane receptor protein